jgi:hypothetical protein
LAFLAGFFHAILLTSYTIFLDDIPLSLGLSSALLVWDTTAAEAIDSIQALICF